MDEEITLAEWPNSSRNVVRVRLCKYRGHLRLDIREFYRKDAELCPGRKGISIEPRRISRLNKAIKKARGLVKETNA